jgi:predicted dinucleotide-binding enzyme
LAPNHSSDTSSSPNSLPPEGKPIAILGTGRVGRALAKRFAALGHTIWMGSRNPATKSTHPDLDHRSIRVVSPEIAIEEADICFLAIPWNHSVSTVQHHSPWHNKILVDCSNPLNNKFDGLELGHHTSAAEQIEQHARDARVVKALNTASVDTMLNPNFNGDKATMFYCGNDTSAKEQVGSLLEQLGFSPVDCGELSQARNLEPLAMLYIHLAVRRGFGSNCAFTILRR